MRPCNNEEFAFGKERKIGKERSKLLMKNATLSTTSHLQLQLEDEASGFKADFVPNETNVKLEEESSEALEDLNEVDKAIGESVVQAGDEGLTIWQNKHSMRQLKDNLTRWTSDLPEDVVGRLMISRIHSRWDKNSKNKEEEEHVMAGGGEGLKGLMAMEVGSNSDGTKLCYKILFRTRQQSFQAMHESIVHKLLFHPKNLGATTSRGYVLGFGGRQGYAYLLFAMP
ncbi:hypothetical protein PIB30_018998 [Stylosanthes scabra]|uniref:Uncharacterized protein n=1 Tax=Stylosanthes scabra TaxID=79078 RepID=A0ABU6Q8N1_9FABA|nr:hypothetical protein [Stylosanthes scabra]